MGPSSGKCVVKVSGGDQEDTITVEVPPISETPEIEALPVRRTIIKRITNTEHKSLQFVKEIRLEEECNFLLLTIQWNDNRECSAILKDASNRELDTGDETIKMVVLLLDRPHVLNFVDDYIKQDRKEVSFFNDALILSRCVSRLVNFSETTNLLKMGSTTELLHNRIVAQLIDYYNDAYAKSYR